MLPCDVNRLQLRASGLFDAWEHVQQCPCGSGAGSLVLVTQGGFEIGHDARIADMAERAERHNSWAGEWVDGQTRQQGDGPLAIRFGRLSQRKGG